MTFPNNIRYRCPFFQGLFVKLVLIAKKNIKFVTRSTILLSLFDSTLVTTWLPRCWFHWNLTLSCCGSVFILDFLQNTNFMITLIITGILHWTACWYDQKMVRHYFHSPRIPFPEHSHFGRAKDFYARTSQHAIPYLRKQNSNTTGLSWLFPHGSDAFLSGT